MTQLGQWELDTVHCTDALTLLKGLPDASINCCVTSPPYFGLRDYGVDEQIGLEETPAEYVAALVDVFREVRRVLTEDGTCWLNLGDSYNSSPAGKNPGGFQGAAMRRNTGYDKAQPRKDKRHTFDGLAEKQLLGIPWRVAFALQSDGWWLRSDIIWEKPNCMPESVTDRPTKSHEYVFLLTKNADYYYDADAIREPYTEPMNRWGGEKLKANGHSAWDTGTGQESYRDRDMRPNANGRNKRSVWTVPTQPFSGAHFATFPPALIEPMILAGCPLNGVVLDPFGGAGTVGLVAQQLNRHYILCDINAEYVEMARMRIAGRMDEHRAMKAGLPYTLPLFEEQAG